MMEWQPIETAPRDGRDILAYNPMVGVYNTAFTKRFSGELDEADYEGFPCGLWASGSPESYNFGRWDCQPTHWMLPPEPPKPSEGER